MTVFIDMGGNVRQPAPNDGWCVGCDPDNCSGCARKGQSELIRIDVSRECDGCGTQVHCTAPAAVWDDPFCPTVLCSPCYLAVQDDPTITQPHYLSWATYLICTHN